MADEQWDMLLSEQGAIALVARDGRLSRVCYQSSAEAAASAVARHSPEAVRGSLPVLELAKAQLVDYLAGRRSVFSVPLADEGLSAFARRVHRELLDVPCGEVVTYGELAMRAGSPRAARAVGRVMASNPFPLLVPCHRVVNADGSLGSYSAADGTRTKAWLIEFERGMAKG